jgi:hypothetical protein
MTAMGFVVAAAGLATAAAVMAEAAGAGLVAARTGAEEITVRSTAADTLSIGFIVVSIRK